MHQGSPWRAREPPTANEVRMSLGKTPRSRNPSQKESFGCAVSSFPIHCGGLDL